MRVDRNALRFNQASIIVFAVLAFVIGDTAGRWVVLGVAAVMLVGTAWVGASMFKLVYRHVFVRAGWLKPDVVAEDPAPHQFAQGMGGVVLVVAFVALVAGTTAVGWALTWLVIALAGVNLVLGFCMGCFIYFQLGRIGLARRPRSAH